MKKIITPIMMILFILSGCATNNVSNSEAIITKDIINTNLTKQDSDKTMVTIKRDSGFNGSACSFKVLIDRTHVANLRGSEKVVIFLNEGSYIITSTANGLCGGGTASHEIEVRKIPKTYRISSGQDGTIVVQPSSF